MKTQSSVPVVVITGASAGVGRAVVRRFACHRARIALIARGEEGLRAAAEEVERAGGHTIVLPCDVSDHAAIEAAADEVENTLGPIDIWINVAFAGIVSTFIDTDPDDYKRVTDVTYLGQVNGTRAALKRMLPRNRGSIVLTGSALAYRGIPLQAAYCGAKHAIQGFQDSVRSELSHLGSRINVTMVQLPGVNTPQFDWIKTNLPMKPKPASPPYQPEVAAAAIYFAAYAGRKQIMVGFPTLQAVWGDRIASPVLDRYLGRTGFKAQQDSQFVENGRRDNLWQPVGGDHGAHGRFDSIARQFSGQLFITTHRKWVFAGLAFAIGLASLSIKKMRSR